ncbi:MAG: hypothetical protein Ta2A_22140 [Treponemataceae bacterium]|nr:MAG: hypothetical protein Ta2A_22140 [Treponemataceae bacterium]
MKNRLICVFWLVLAVILSACGYAKKNAQNGAEVFYLQAVEKYADGNIGAAESLCENALAKNKDFFQAELLLAKTLFFQNKPDEALKVLSRLKSRKKNYLEARFWHIRTLQILGRNAEAKNALDFELTLNPGDWRLYYQYALLAGSENDYEKQIAFLRLAQTQLAASAGVYADLAAVWASLGLPERAQKLFELKETIENANSY